MYMRKETISLIVLSLLSAGLMSLPFLAPHCSIAALFGLVPLLCMNRIAEVHNIRRFWFWHYLTFVLWNAATTFWVCNATVGGGLFAIFANAFQMSLIFGLFRWSKKHFRGTLPYIFLAVMWIAWERFYLVDAEISWPWLVLGNSFASSVSLVQWYEYLGTLGGSLWIWACNLAVFGLLCLLADDKWSRINGKARFSAVAATLLLFAAPMVISEIMYRRHAETDQPLDVIIAQPNIDPYQKFQALSQDEQNDILESQIRGALTDRDTSATSPVLVLGPETFTSDIYTDNPEDSRTFARFTKLAAAYPGANITIGATTRTLVFSRTRPSETAWEMGKGNGIWLESHNSALITDGSGRYDICHKNCLVPGVEKMAYPKLLRPLDEKLGYVMGRYTGTGKPALLNIGTADGTRIPFGCAICYESIYGEYCAGYIREGARALAVITNDAWWKDTPGYRQHLNFAALRAIETRRDIARCANTGISAIINQRGDIIVRTKWWERDVIEGRINLNDEITFFVKNGDIVGKFSTFLFCLLLLALIARSFIPKSLRK